MKFILRLLAALLLMVYATSCGKVLRGMYGIRQVKHLSPNEMEKWAYRISGTDSFHFFVDTSFRQYTSRFPPATDTEYSVGKGLFQPVQAMYFDSSGKMIAYFVNCYAQGFPNLKWNKDGNFNTFPPATMAPPFGQVTLPQLKQALQPINAKSMVRDTTTAYTVVFFWDRMMYRQGKRLACVVRKNIQGRNVQLLYVNNDALYYGK